MVYRAATKKHGKRTVALGVLNSMPFYGADAPGFKVRERATHPLTVPILDTMAAESVTYARLIIALEGTRAAVCTKAACDLLAEFEQHKEAAAAPLASGASTRQSEGPTGNLSKGAAYGGLVRMASQRHVTLNPTCQHGHIDVMHNAVELPEWRVSVAFGDSRGARASRGA